MDDTHRVLMLTYHFPPSGGSGVQRSSKFAKYLPSFGWRPVVIAAKPIAADSTDAGLLKDLPPGLEVHRLTPLEPLAFRRLLRRALRPDLRTDAASSTEGRARVRFYGSLKRFKNGLSGLLFPDEQVLWSLGAAALGALLASRQSFEVVYSSGSPFSSHVGAIALGRLIGRPVVVDFRDPWTTSFIYRHTGLRRALEQSVERTVLRSARMVVCNHEAMARDFRNMAPECDPAKFVVITNGYDEDDFAPDLLAPQRSPGQFVLSHIGFIYPGTGLALLEALKRLEAGRPDLARRLRVRLVGALPLHEEEAEFLHRTPLASVDTVTSRVSHRESLVEMISADALILLLINDKRGEKWYPGKVFEYLRSGRPILALVPPKGIAADLVRRSGRGIVVDPGNPGAVAKVIEDLVELGEQMHAQSDAGTDFACQFERRELTRGLAGVLEAAALGSTVRRSSLYAVK